MLHPDPENWWYYAFKTGQHVSFFQRRNWLEVLANKLSLKLYSSGSFHVLTDRTMNQHVYRVLAHPAARFLSVVPRCLMASKTMADHVEIMRRAS